MSPIKRMTSAFSSAGDRSSRFPGGDMPLQNLKSLYAESPDLPIFTRAVSPCPPRLPSAKPPLPGLLPLLHPCNKVFQRACSWYAVRLLQLLEVSTVPPLLGCTRSGLTL